MDDLVSSPEIDRRLGWTIGRADSLARRGKLPHFRLPDGSVRFRWAEIEPLIQHVSPDATKGHAESEVRS